MESLKLVISLSDFINGCYDGTHLGKMSSFVSNMDQFSMFRVDPIWFRNFYALMFS